MGRGRGECTGRWAHARGRVRPYARRRVHARRRHVHTFSLHQHTIAGRLDTRRSSGVLTAASERRPAAAAARSRGFVRRQCAVAVRRDAHRSAAAACQWPACRCTTTADCPSGYDLLQASYCTGRYRTGRYRTGRYRTGRYRTGRDRAGR